MLFQNQEKDYLTYKMLQSINLFKKEVAFLWEDNTTTVIEISKLRQLCPCAFCSGEKDALGNKYGGVEVKVNQEISISRFERVGYNGLQCFFSDGHKDGIYTFVFLKTF